MVNIITAYLAREILKASLATLLILYVILISNALGRLLADIADGDIPAQAMWPVMLSHSTNVLSLLLPIGVFLGIVFAFGRMYKDHEIVIMNACGIGYLDFYKPVALVLLPVFAFSVYASLWLNPQVQRNARNIIESEKDGHEFQQIKPGQFNQGNDGKLVFYMESISEDRLELRNIIISQVGSDGRVLETADSGRQKIEQSTGNLFLVIGPGKRYEGQPGELKHHIISYDQHGILLRNKAVSGLGESSSEQRTPYELWHSSSVQDRIELHWRIATPVILLVLSLIAVPLAYVPPRQGRFGRVGYALAVYIAYFNLMAVARGQLSTGMLPLELNFWWVHGIFVILAGVLFYRRNGGFMPGRATA